MSEMICPFCGEGEAVYVGLLRDKNRGVYRCRECDRYFSVEELSPPFEITIEEQSEGETA